MPPEVHFAMMPVICIASSSYSLPYVKKALEEANIPILSAKITMVPKTLVPIAEEGTAQTLLKLVEALDDLDDVQQVYANFDIPEKIMETLSR